MASIAETDGRTTETETDDDETETDYDGRTFWFKEKREEVVITIIRRPDNIPTFGTAIDMISLEKLERPVVTKCGHVFSYDTLKEWLTMNDTCPKCRTQIKFDKQVVVYSAMDSGGRDEEGNVIYHELPPMCPLRF